jgi:hypothetical protein
MTNLTEQDLKRIEAIKKYIEQLHLLVSELTPYQPIDTTEGEYVRCVNNKTKKEQLSIGKIYQVVKSNLEKYTLVNDLGIEKTYFEERFEPATHAEFLAQEQVEAPIETEQRWKPSNGQPYYYIDFTLKYTVNRHSASENTRILSGNCFKTQEIGGKALSAIKKYLSTNNF